MKNVLEKMVSMYEVFCRILLLSMSSLVIIFVFMRYFLGITFVWAEELITMLFIGTTYFGAVLSMKYKEHINISLLADKIPAAVHKYVEILNYLIIFLLQIAIVYTSIHWIGRVGNVLTNGMRLPIRFFYYMMPISSVLIGIFCLIHIYMLISNKEQV